MFASFIKKIILSLFISFFFVNLRVYANEVKSLKEDNTSKVEVITDDEEIEEGEEFEHFTDSVKLKAINKISTRISILQLKRGEETEFGNLSIKMHSCWRSSKDEEPENKVLLSLYEKLPGEANRLVFSGWMFSSSPAINSMQHPVYDISVVECF